LLIVINSDLVVKDAFFIENESTTESDNLMTIEFNLKFFQDKEDHEKLMEIQEKIKHHEDIHEIVNNKFSKSYNYNEIKPIIIPFNLKEIIDNLNLPSFNINLLNFCLSIIEFKEKKQNIDKNLKYLFDILFKNEDYTAFISNLLDIFSDTDVKQWLTIWGTLLDDLMINILIIDKERIIFGCRFIVEDRKFTINPLPVHVYAPTIRKNENLADIAKDLHEKTGLRTLISPLENVIALFGKIMEGKPNLLDVILKIFEWSEISQWYPGSILGSFLRLFGFKLGKDITQFSNAFNQVIKNFEDILIATFRIHGKKDYYKSYQTFIHLTFENETAKIKLIDSRPYKHLLEEKDINSVERLKKMKEEIEKKSGITFKACLGFDINILAESISTQNIETLLKIKNMAHQLPFVASLGALFAGMKALNVEDTLEGNGEILEIAEQEQDNLIEQPLKFKEYFDAFLKKGILFLSDQEKSMGNIRTPIYSKDGFLGLDMDLIRGQIEKKTKN
jgi:hypothetical protein